MKINLSEISSYVISLGSDPELSNVLINAGYRNPTVMPGHRLGIKAIGIAYSHYNVLKNVTDSPFIVFEEDARFFRTCDTIEIPDDADAVYLGAGIGEGLVELSTAKVEGHPGVYRIFNPLGAHAILYLSNRFIDEATKVARYTASLRLPTYDIDSALNIINNRFNIYAVDPIFYQHNPKNPKMSNYTRIKSLDTMQRDPIF